MPLLPRGGVDCFPWPSARRRGRESIAAESTDLGVDGDLLGAVGAFARGGVPSKPALDRPEAGTRVTWFQQAGCAEGSELLGIRTRGAITGEGDLLREAAYLGQALVVLHSSRRSARLPCRAHRGFGSTSGEQLPCLVDVGLGHGSTVDVGRT